MIQIIGGGISGLLCAYYAIQKGHKVELYEKQEKLGGKIATLHHPLGLMETAANAFLADAEVESVCREIGVSLISKNKVAQNRYIYAKGQISRWPLSFADNWSLFNFVLRNLFFKNSLLPLKNETLQHWGQRVLNPAIAENLVDPACLGIFGVPSEKLSATLIYNYIFRRQRKYGTLKGSVAPEKGMGDFILQMQKYLKAKGVVFYTQRGELGKTIGQKDSLILATDLSSAIELLKEHGDHRASVLAQVPTVDLLSVNVFYKQRPVLQKPGFGVLFARKQGIVPLGVLFNSDIFQGRAQDCHSETWIFGGMSPEVLLAKSESEILQIISQTRKSLWQEEVEPIRVRLNAWPQAIPLYGLQLEKTLENLEISKNNIHLMGNYLGEIGLNRLFHRAQSLIAKIN